MAALAYVYVVYPLILMCVKGLRPRPLRKRAIEPTVCLFVAANDEAAVIEAKIRNALALDYPPDRLDIVIASDGSVDGTNDIVRRFAPRVRLLEFTPRRGKIGTIIRGMRGRDRRHRRAVGRQHVPAAVRHPRAGARTSRTIRSGASAATWCWSASARCWPASEDLYYRYERWIQRAESEIGSMIGADGALYAIRRRLFEPPAADTILDDMAIPMAVVRKGYRVVFEPEARAHEQGVETAREEFSRKSRVVAGAIQFLTRRDSNVPAGARR